MAYIRSGNGGGGGTDTSREPDKLYQNTSMAQNATANITVTQMPKVIEMVESNTGGSAVIGVYNVEQDTGWLIGYYSSAMHSQSWNGSSYFTSITSSNVTFKNAGFSGTSRVSVAIFY